MNLSDSVSKVPLVGPSYAHRLERLEISTVRDLLYHLPFRYDDFSSVSKITNLQEGEIVTVQGKVLEMKNIFTRRGFVLQQATVEDNSGSVDALWFNQRFLTRVLKKGDQVNLSGKVKRSGNKLQLESPDYEVIRPITSDSGDALFTNYRTVHTGRLVPVYPETAGISSKWLRSRIYKLLEAVSRQQLAASEYLDEKTRKENDLLEFKTAILQVHFPDNLDLAEKARNRLAFDELLLSQLESQSRRKTLQSQTVGNKFKITEIRSQLKTFVDKLPFKLTRAQKIAVDQIYKDLAKNTPMNRLLQGDVGSGKTVVAALAILAAYLNGYQSVLMAPTEILANQHYNTLLKLLKPLRIGVGIATSSRKDYQGLDIVVGTHALLSDQLNFKKLGLAVIDEQHRFGVEQRAKLTAKGINPHVLTMTATPIPRTVTLTLYGDLDMSVLSEMPVGRKPVKTWVIPPEKRLAAYKWIENQKTQTFIICPLIEQSESETLLEVKAAKKEFDYLSKEIFPDLKVGLIHGRLKSKEKESVLSSFRNKKLDILVATPVVEVGIDIPAATIMVIEAAERFGLAQLHQLRGRVGRGEEQSFCLLFTQDSPAQNRLKYLESVNDGLKLAEIDLSFRGPGERFGLAQHGKWDLKIASFDNLELVEKSNQLAQKVLANPRQFPLLFDMIKQSKINVVPN